jgi:hypothetical protein
VFGIMDGEKVKYGAVERMITFFGGELTKEIL